MSQDYYSILKGNYGDNRQSIRRSSLQQSTERTSAHEKDHRLIDAYEILSEPSKQLVCGTKFKQGFNDHPTTRLSRRKTTISNPDSFDHLQHGSDCNESKRFKPVERTFSQPQSIPHISRMSDRSVGSDMKIKPIEHDLYVNLDSLKQKSIKHIRITRQTKKPLDKGTILTDEKIITVTIPAGCPRGTRIRYCQEGDPKLSILPIDVIFTIYDSKHSLFTRYESDLISKVSIGLRLALLGGEIKVIGLGNERWTVSVPPNTESGDKYEIPNAGLPIPSEMSEAIRGNLVLLFEVRMPKVQFRSYELHNLATILPQMTPTQSATEL